MSLGDHKSRSMGLKDTSGVNTRHVGVQIQLHCKSKTKKTKTKKTKIKLK